VDVSDDSKYGRIRDRAYVKTLVVAALIGVPVALAAILFTSAVHGLEELLWHDIPNEAGWAEPAWWYVLAVPAVGGALVAAALRLPGKGGHPAIEGLGLQPLRPLELPSVLAASLVTLGFGLVLGPEAPLMALGLTFGLVAAQLVRLEGENGRDLVFAGAFAALASILGGPLIAAFMIFELVAASGTVPAAKIGHMLVPGFIAGGTGYLVFIGVADWPGLDAPVLALDVLPTYTAVRLVDLGWCLVLAVAVAVLVVASRRIALRTLSLSVRRPGVALVLAGFAVGAIALVFRALTDRPVDLVLFSGQAALPEAVLEGSAWVLALLVVAKMLAYGISLGAGFRGGPIFPAIAIGVFSGVLAASVLPGLDLTPAVVAGLAAGAASALKLPFIGALMAGILGGAAAADAIPITIGAAVVAWLVTLALDHPVKSQRPREEPSTP
jgi:H+/Cl- antiporter ClcA